jgi:hypothetical protein
VKHAVRTIFLLFVHHQTIYLFGVILLGKITSFPSMITMPKDVSARSQLKTTIELSLAQLVSKCSIGVLR